MLYNTCQQCGANLDPGEQCDCKKDDLEAIGLERIGTYLHPDVNGGKPIPLYEMGGFINTLEGWNMLAVCKTPEDYDRYHEAQDAYDLAHGRQPKPRKPTPPGHKPFVIPKKETAPDAGTSKGGSKAVIDQDDTHSIHPSSQRTQGEV